MDEKQTKAEIRRVLNKYIAWWPIPLVNDLYKFMMDEQDKLQKFILNEKDKPNITDIADSDL